MASITLGSLESLHRTHKHGASTRTSSVRMINESCHCIHRAQKLIIEFVSRLHIDCREAVPGEDHGPNLPGKITFCQEMLNGLFLYITEGESQRMVQPCFCSLLAVQHRFTNKRTVNPPRDTYLGIESYLKKHIYATVSQNYRDKTVSQNYRCS